MVESDTSAVGIGARIRQLRKKKKMTQAQIGGLCGVTPQAVTQWERGSSKSPTAANLLIIAAALDANPVWLVTGKGDPHRVPTGVPGDRAELVSLYDALDPAKQQDILSALRVLAAIK